MIPRPAIAVDHSGRGICVALIDSGTNFTHPHLAIEGRGFAVLRDPTGAISVVPGAHADRYGHGTCCAALLHLLAPQAELLSIRVTAEGPGTDLVRLSAAIRLAAKEGAALIAIPLGAPATADDRDLDAGLEAALEEAQAAGAVVLAASPEHAVVPASSPRVRAIAVGVEVDVARQGSLWVADPRPRPAPTPGGGNFFGPSLSVARAAAAMARFAELTGARGAALITGFENALPMR